MGQCCNTIPWTVNYALTFSLIILSKNLKFIMQIYEKYIVSGIYCRN